MPQPELIGVQRKDNKQGRNLATLTLREQAEAEVSVDLFRGACQIAFGRYGWLLRRGVPRELARSVLPLGTYSHMFGTVNLLNFLHFLSLRSDTRAQYEIRVYALAMRDLVREVVPTCIAAWEQGVSSIAPSPGPGEPIPARA